MPSTFVRSVSGLINFRRFIKCTFVVYCEGGSQNIPLSDALSGRYNESAEDRTFWDALLRRVGFQDIHFKPLGSSRHVIDIADFIITHNIHGNLAVMDRDFPGKKKTFTDYRVLYSFGYSWENDVVIPKVVAETTVNMLHLEKSITADLETEFQKLLNRLIRIAKWPIFLQLRTSNPDCDFVPTDPNFGGCILSDSPSVRLDSRPLRDRVRRNRGRFVASATPSSTNLAGRYIPGHALMGLGYAFVISKSAIRPAFRPSRTSFSAMMLRTFSSDPRSYLRQDTMTYYHNWARGVRQST
jgi:hypothetical protein